MNPGVFKRVDHAHPQTAVDDELARRAAELLGTHPYPPLRRVRVLASDGVVTLVGRVPNFYSKQVAQSLIVTLPEVRTIVNQLEVGALHN